MTTTELHPVNAVNEMIQKGRTLLLAGEENLLSQLVDGKWIAGTSANFMTSEGGTESLDGIFVTDVSDIIKSADIKTYDTQSLATIGSNYPENGFTVLIIPGMSEIHGAFSKNVQNYEGVFNAALTGWISGVPVADIGKKAPKVFAGSKLARSNEAVAMHITLPHGKAAKMDIINLFAQGDGDEILFKGDGFDTTGSCTIGDKETSLAAYIQEKGIDTSLPLVADYNGAMINVSIQSVDKDNDKVSFYAPVFKGISYRFAKPVPDYTTAFDKILSENDLKSVVFSCNCILNFLYAKLEGKKTGHLVGPITFGEIAYMLLNQTLVHLIIEDV